MGTKKKQQSVPEKLKPLWQKYSLHFCGGLLVLLVLFSFLLWYETVHAPASVAGAIRSQVEKFAAGDGSAVFEIQTVSDRHAILKMASPDLELEDVILSYSPEGISAGRINGISIGRVRIKSGFLTGCRKLLELRNRRYLQMAGNVTIREIVYGKYEFKDLVMSLVTLKGTLADGTEIAYNPEKNQLHLKNHVFFVPEMFFSPAEWAKIPAEMRFFNLPSGNNVFRAQELVLDLTEKVHPFKRIVKMQAENLAGFYDPKAEQPCGGYADSIKYDAQNGALEVNCYLPQKTECLLKATLNADGDVTFRKETVNTQDGSFDYWYDGKIDSHGEIRGKGRSRSSRRLREPFAQEDIRELGDYGSTTKITYKQLDYSGLNKEFTVRIPEAVIDSKNVFSVRNAEIDFHSVPFTAKEIFADWKQNYSWDGTFSVGAVYENSRKIGSIASGTLKEHTFSGKAELYGLDGTVNGKIHYNPTAKPDMLGKIVELEYMLSFPRQQIKNAGSALLPVSSPVRLQGFASLKMDHKGLFDLVIDNGELDLAPVKLSNFSMSARTQTFAFDSADFCGIKFGKGQGKYQLENGKIKLDGMTFEWCGGKCRLLPQLEKGRYLLDCSDLLLPDFFKAMGIGTFEGTGRISGKIPVTVAEDGMLSLEKTAFYSVPGSSETLKGTLHENYSSGDPAYMFVTDVMRSMKYDWVRLDFLPPADGGKYTLRVSFRGKPDQPLNYELAPGANGGTTIRKTEKAGNFGYLNLSLNLGLGLEQKTLKQAVRNIQP